jgi:hypothetical protein
MVRRKEHRGQGVQQKRHVVGGDLEHGEMRGQICRGERPHERVADLANLSKVDHRASDGLQNRSRVGGSILVG